MLLVLSVWPPRRPGPGLGWVLLGAGAALAVAVRWLPVDGALRGLADGPLPGALLLAGWAVVAAGRIAHGVRRHRPSSLRIGLGLGVLAAAQLVQLAGRPAGMSDLLAAGLRLLGLVIVLVGPGPAARSPRGAAFSVQQQEVLAAAALAQQRTDELAAERDHELRNGLAGLAGITHLLSSDGHEHEPLKHAVLAELGRLHLILNGPLDEPEEPGRAEPATDYLVEPVLNGLVTLRRHGGDRVRLRVEPGLRARGHSTVLAQVVTNLLANCDRHAPGAAVAVSARSDAGVVVVEVRDTGPGLPSGADVLAPGVHDPAGGGPVWASRSARGWSRGRAASWPSARWTTRPAASRPCTCPPRPPARWAPGASRYERSNSRAASARTIPARPSETSRRRAGGCDSSASQASAASTVALSTAHDGNSPTTTDWARSLVRRDHTSATSAKYRST